LMTGSRLRINLWFSGRRKPAFLESGKLKGKELPHPNEDLRSIKIEALDDPITDLSKDWGHP